MSWAGRGRTVRAAGLAAPLAAALAAVLAIAGSDQIRGRADAALARGVPAREAALARGFVLGDDERVDPLTKEDFRRAGLSHLMAASGQNVALLALLAWPLLALLGMPLRPRLLWTISLIAAYVPLAGAGPTIQRAAVMGGLDLLATLAGRRSSRAYALAAAALLTLAIDPSVAADPGWQLSFAAVLGILLLFRPLRALLRGPLGDRGPGGWLAEALALTIAATLATAPLIAHDFEQLSTVTLLANVLAAPAVAPAMWLGMAAAAAGQVPGFPVEVFTLPAALLLAYVAQVAAWCASPSWAMLEVRLGLAGMALAYAGIVALALSVASWRRRRGLAARRPLPADGTIGNAMRARSSRRRRNRGSAATAALAAAVAVAAVVLLFLAPGGRDEAIGPPRSGLRVSVLDVGQGDSILLQPARAPAVLVDTGPPGDGLAAQLARAGARRIGILALTHDQSDHAGGLAELLGSVPVGTVAYSFLGGRTRALAGEAGAALRRVGEGSALRSGRLRLEALWPPRSLFGSGAPAEPNADALVLLARWGDFTMLLSADAEAEAVPLDPGPLDVLKLAHHGSEDAGLPALLARTSPALAVISVGAGNPYGHPMAAALADLEEAGVPTLRTDRDGTVVLDVSADGSRARVAG